MRRLFCLLALVTTTATAQTPPTSQTPAIVTSATGEARAQPDRATIVFAVETHATTAAAAGSANAAATRRVLDTLRAAGLTAEQVGTIGYSVSPEYQNDPAGRVSRVVGYTARNSIRADIQQIERVGPLIDAALAKGANSVGSLRFFSSRADDLRRQALATAVQRARADAEAMARAAGGTLGAPIEIAAGFAPRQFEEAQMRMVESAAYAATPIQAGEQTITATVTVRWTFVP